MEQFLSETRHRLTTGNFTTLNIVLGNESCDLDSAVSALVYAAFLSWQHETIKCGVCTKDKRDPETYKDEVFVPILNVDRVEYELKTEVVYCLSQAGIDAAKLIFRDDFDFNHLEGLHKTSVVLVDHHVLAERDKHLSSKVTEIIDHRPQDKSDWSYALDVRCTIEQVGSCAALVAERVRTLSELRGRSSDFFVGCLVAADLLHSTIILDTVNFSKEVKKATPKDLEMVLYLEDILKSGNAEEFRSSKLERLVRARTDISKLSVDGILRKDAKIIGNIYVPSFPILVEQLLRKENVTKSIEDSLVRNNCTIALLLGMKLDGGLERDAAIYSTGEHKERAGQLSNLLQEWTLPRLELKQINVPINNCSYFVQLNKAASRKQYIPIIKHFLSKENV